MGEPSHCAGAPQLAAAPDPASHLTSLPMHLLEAVFEHMCPISKAALLRTCKPLRQALLQNAPRLALNADQLGSDRSYREVREVVRRQRAIQELILTVKRSAHAQRLMSELSSEAPNPGSPPCAVHALVLDHGCVHSRWSSRLGAALPSITSLELRWWGTTLDGETLQALAACTRLRTLDVSAARLGRGVTRKQRRSGLPAVIDLVLAHDAALWISALAPQLTSLTVVPPEAAWVGAEDSQPLGSPFEVNYGAVHPLYSNDLTALGSCSQLEAVELIVVDQPTLEVLLGLTSLTQVYCDSWEADARGRSCGWVLLHIENVQAVPEAVDCLPRGAAAVRFASLTLCASSTPEDSADAAQAFASAMAGANMRVSWCAPAGRLHPQLALKANTTQPYLSAACIAAALGCLAPLSPFSPQFLVALDVTPRMVDAALLHALSAASVYIRHLDIHCSSVAADGLGRLCHTAPGEPGSGLRAMTVAVATSCGVPDRVRTRLQLTRLQAELEARGAPVQLCVTESFSRAHGPWMLPP